VAVHEIAKPGGVWCPHARPGAGCAIYGSHPNACRSFVCAWLENPELDESWKPEACGFVLRTEDDGRRLCIDVDAARPDAWREAPFHEALKAWAFDRLRRGGHAVVYVEDKVIALFPEEELDLGRLAQGDALIAGYKIEGATRRPMAVIARADGSRETVTGGTYAHAG
jgi:Fe-S-cluster containining protein